MFQNVLFSNLPKNFANNLQSIFSSISIEEKIYSTGRTPYPRASLLNALIFKNLFSISTFADLSRTLLINPEIAHICGFSSFPSKERFSSFIRNSDNSIFQNVRLSLISKLISLNQISARFIAADSCPIKANVKQNNLKTNVKNRFFKYSYTSRRP